jgi:hypothetical protein
MRRPGVFRSRPAHAFAEAGGVIMIRTRLINRTSSVGDAAHPVELLRDARGVYGIGVSDLFDLEAVAWSCGIEPADIRPHTFERPHTLILRPDRFSEPLPPYGSRAVLQKITGGFRRGPFMRTHEEQLRQFIHHEALDRAGLPWPPEGERWWSTDKKQQARNRAIYHGLRQLSLHVVNRLIGAALEGAADGDAVKAARRFSFRYREKIYRASARSRRARQLTDTFPVLALVLYADHSTRRIDRFDFKDWETEHADIAARKNCATDLVERGARLRDVAGAMGIPMALRHIKPGVAHWATETFCRYPELLNFMPSTTPRQHIWLLVVGWAISKTDAEFGKWGARHVPNIRGRTHREVGNFLADIVDWLRPDKAAGREFITRPFTPSMSLNTVIQLSAEWHEAVADNLANGPDARFPPPWYPAAKLGDYEIMPIEDAATLYREGVAMHHCIGTYADRVQSGNCCVYSVRRNGERIATLALGHDNGRTYLDQIRGACNTQPGKKVVSPVLRWLSDARRSLPLAAPGAATARGDLDIDDAEIPF